MLVHTDAVQFSCEFCEKAFISNSKLIAHRRIHTGERPFLCEICQKSFYSCSELLKHKQSTRHLQKLEFTRKSVPLSEPTSFGFKMIDR